MTLTLVFLGGAIGSVLRYLTDRFVQSRHRLGFPLGTLTVNVVGSFVLGVVTAGVTHHHWSGDVGALIGTGLCGGLTTFSTFAVETVELGRARRRLATVGYVAVSLALGIGAAALGWLV